MKKFLLFFAFLCFAVSFSQNSKPSLGFNMITITPMGNNYLKDGVKPFVGFGVTFQSIYINKLGFGIEISQAFSQVKNKTIYGDLEKPRLTNITTYLNYKYPFSNGISLQGQMGAGFLNLANQSLYTEDIYKENGISFLVGTEVSYKFPKSKGFEIYASPKLYFFKSQVDFEDSELDKYYSQSRLLYLNVGIRLNINEK